MITIVFSVTRYTSKQGQIRDSKWNRERWRWRYGLWSSKKKVKRVEIYYCVALSYLLFGHGRWKDILRSNDWLYSTQFTKARVTHGDLSQTVHSSLPKIWLILNVCLQGVFDHRTVKNKFNPTQTSYFYFIVLVNIQLFEV